MQLIIVVDNKNMKNLNEYKVSENIIDKRIKELAFNITKKIFSAIT